MTDFKPLQPGGWGTGYTSLANMIAGEDIATTDSANTFSSLQTMPDLLIKWSAGWDQRLDFSDGTTRWTIMHDNFNSWENETLNIENESGTQVMTFLQWGNVLIGTTTDSWAKLQVNGDINAQKININSTDCRLEFTETSWDNFRLQNQNGTFKLINATDSTTMFEALWDGRFFITGWNVLVTNGNVWIGITNPWETLHVNWGIRIGTTTNAVAGNLRYNSATNKHQWYNGTTWNDLY